MNDKRDKEALFGSVKFMKMYLQTRGALQQNKDIEATTIYYYSQARPTTEGNYWRYVDGVPTAW